jgi:hypothetical protein
MSLTPPTLLEMGILRQLREGQTVMAAALAIASCSASLEAPELDEVWDETRMVVGSVSNDGSTSIVERFTLDDRPKH